MQNYLGRAPTNISTDYKTVDWTDLMPANDLEALLNPPDYVSQVSEGAAEDKRAGMLKSSIAVPKDRYQQALVSSNVRPELDGTDIRIAGYLVPVDYNNDQQATAFFAVPFFGACLHLPPPPPNQIILVHSEQGVEIDDIYTPYWLSGELNTDLLENDIAESAYTMTLQRYELYAEP
ncbi:hypothetical protein AB833_02435 [Chromatiales bacterium (ex Bugula neritina AB1)]|nr:hypothetical protein AB833_02435 [Chromatiales bacterium (ex Bugula neritina AB1)]